MKPPAARRKKSKVPQRAINTMDTILVDCCHDSNPVKLSRVERRHAGGRQLSGVLCHSAMAVPRRLTREVFVDKKRSGAGSVKPTSPTTRARYVELVESSRC